MGHNSVSRVRVHEGTQQFILCVTLPYVQGRLARKVWAPISPLAPPVSGRSTALNGPEGPKMAENHQKRTRSAPRVCSGGFHIVTRLATLGAPNAPSWGPCDPPGLRFLPVWARGSEQGLGGQTMTQKIKKNTGFNEPSFVKNRVILAGFGSSPRGT